MTTPREWHGCIDPRGHSFVEGVCQTEGCGTDLRNDGDLLGGKIQNEPTSKELVLLDRQREAQCTICPPNRGDNAGRWVKHGVKKPKGKRGR